MYTCIIYIIYHNINRLDRFRTHSTASGALPGLIARLVSYTGAGCDKVWLCGLVAGDAVAVAGALLYLVCMSCVHQM